MRHQTREHLPEESLPLYKDQEHGEIGCQLYQDPEKEREYRCRIHYLLLTTSTLLNVVLVLLLWHPKTAPCNKNLEVTKYGKWIKMLLQLSSF